MAGSVKISPLTPDALSQDFKLLRETGMEVLRRIASESWTDHNLHDPGITLLEAFCYATTEAALKAGMNIRDLIESGKVVAPPEFFTAAQVLPVMPVTMPDFRKVLIDHPLVRNAWLSEVDVIPKGRYDVLLEYADDVINAFRFTETITTAISQYLVEITLPHWDEPEVIPLRTNVALQAALFDNAAWSPIEGSDAWFNRILLDYQPLIGPIETTPLWVVVSIISPMANPAVELPLILQATGTLILTIGSNTPADQTLLKRYQRRVIEAHETTLLISEYLRGYRNLGEYFHEFRSARVQEIAFAATIEVATVARIEEFLADVFFEVDQMIAPALLFQSLEQLNHKTSDEIFDGPFLDSGFLSDVEKISTPLPEHVYSSDILRIIFQQGSSTKSDVESRAVSQRTVTAVRDLRLSNFLDGRSISSDARDCLRLVNSKRHIPRFSPEKCKVFLYRDGIEVGYDFARVLQLFAQKKSAIDAGAIPGSADLSVPTGEGFALSDYYPIQNDLPLIYGVGEAGLPDHALAERRARAKQLKGYLMFPEQLLAGYVSQLENVNHFFSSNPEVEATMFQQPLYHLPGVADILKAFDPVTMTWQNFIADDENDYRNVLSQSETHDQFLDRRNRMLDHLLARMGEHMEDLASQELRNAASIPDASAMTLPQLLAKQLQRRRHALRHLIDAKSAFYRELPEIQSRRLQSYGNVLWHHEDLATFQQNSTGVSWQLHNATGQPVLEQFSIAPNITEAKRLTQLTIALATQPSNYTIVPAGGQRRLEIRAVSGVAAISRSVQLFPNVIAAQAGIQAIALEIRRTWVSHALMSLERRLYHQLPIRSLVRRAVIHSLTEFFEILNDPGGSPMNEKIFRLWERLGFSGAQLLRSEGNFPGLTNAISIANAQAGIREVITHGIDDTNYTIEGASPSFNVVLRNPANTIIARSPSVFTDTVSAKTEIERITSHLYLNYSVEGFYVLENVLLFTSSGVQLEIGSAGKDPYSLQISFVFPSGYIRDFISGLRTSDMPAKFRDAEFRKHAERMIRRACPAHLLPRVYWVDRAVTGAVLAGTEPCFDLFEGRYLAWLEAFLTDRVNVSVMDPLRDALTLTLNRIVLEAETTL